MIEHYNQTLPIEVMFDQIEEGIEVVESASCPYKKKLQKAYLLILQTGK